MANGTGGRGLAAVLTVIAIVVLVGGTAILIESYSGGGDQATTVTATETAAGVTTGQPSGGAPIGGVATGGGGTATDAGSVALPVLSVLAAVTVLAGAAGVAWRQRLA